MGLLGGGGGVGLEDTVFCKCKFICHLHQKHFFFENNKIWGYNGIITQMTQKWQEG